MRSSHAISRLARMRSWGRSCPPRAVGVQRGTRLDASPERRRRCRGWRAVPPSPTSSEGAEQLVLHRPARRGAARVERLPVHLHEVARAVELRRRGACGLWARCGRNGGGERGDRGCESGGGSPRRRRPHSGPCRRGRWSRARPAAALRRRAASAAAARGSRGGRAGSESRRHRGPTCAAPAAPSGAPPPTGRAGRTSGPAAPR